MLCLVNGQVEYSLSSFDHGLDGENGVNGVPVGSGTDSLGCSATSIALGKSGLVHRSAFHVEA